MDFHNTPHYVVLVVITRELVQRYASHLNKRKHHNHPRQVAHLILVAHLKLVVIRKEEKL